MEENKKIPKLKIVPTNVIDNNPNVHINEGTVHINEGTVHINEGTVWKNGVNVTPPTQRPENPQGQI